MTPHLEIPSLADHPNLSLYTGDERLEPAYPAEPDFAAELPPCVARVLHVINGEHYSGAERVQDLLALQLPRVGFDVAFACVKPDRFPALRQSQQAPLFELPMRSRLDWGAVRRLTRIVRDEGFAIVHAHTPRSALVGRLAAWRAGVPFVYHVHSPTSRDSTRPWQNRCNAWAERCALIGAARLIVVSASLGRHMQSQGYSTDQVAVVPNGVPGLAALPARRPPQGEWTFGVVALFRPRKGLEVLLEALGALRRAGLPVRLRAIGGFETPEYEAQIRVQVDRLHLHDAIDWTGFTRDVAGELAQLDAMVLPSLFGEGLPMVVLEAMAAGVPVVATKVEGVPEAIRDEVDGLLAWPNDAADLAGAMRKLVIGVADWAALRESAFRRHADHFSDRAMAAGVAKAYREILK